MKKKYFTLMELAVVLVAAGVLVCLVLGAVSDSAAKAAVCADRGRLLQKAWQSYAEDFKSGPYSLCGYEGDWQKYYWREGLWPYLGIGKDENEWKKNYWCPEVDRFKSSWISINTGIAPNNRKGTPARLEDFRKPDRTVVMTDSKWDTYTNLWGGSFTSRHDNGYTCSFIMADGSAHRDKTLSPIAFDGEERASYPSSQFYYTAAADKKGWPGLNYDRYE